MDHRIILQLGRALHRNTLPAKPAVLLVSLEMLIFAFSGERNAGGKPGVPGEMGVGTPYL